jgi:chaperonin GroES
MIKPLPGYVLIEPIEEEEKSAGGVYLPESAKDKPSKGRVIACGEGEHVITEKIDGIKMAPVMAGQIVVYKKWTNQEVQHEGKEYLLVKFDELLAIIE